MQVIWRCLGRRPHLQDWVDRPFSATTEHGPRAADRRDCIERTVGVEASGPPQADGPHRRVAEAILAYQVFPPTLVSPVLSRSALQMGDTVGILYHFMPGLDLFCAARVIERFDEARDGWWRCGFTYRTVAGHPALGEETFSVDKDLATGRVVASLRSWSRPGTWLTWLASPYLRHLQVHAANAALDHLADVAVGR
jgi:uncharacterized protein (UPF0548 family)